MTRFIQVAGFRSSHRQNVVELVEKLVSFADLPTGWCYGDGVEITQGTIVRAQDVLAAMLLLGASRLDVIPTIQNQVEVIGSIGQCVVECFAAEGRPFEALVEFSDGREDKEFTARSVAELQNMISATVNKCDTSDLLTPSTTRKFISGTQALRSKNLPMEEGPLSSNWIVWRLQPSQFVSTSGHSMSRTYLENRPFFSSSTRQRYLQAAG